MGTPNYVVGTTVPPEPKPSLAGQEFDFDSPQPMGVRVPFPAHTWSDLDPFHKELGAGGMRL